MDRAWKLYKNHSEFYSLEAVCLLSTHKAFLYISLYKAVVYLIHSTQPTSSVTHGWSRSDYFRMESNLSVMSCVLPTMNMQQRN
jgi:hypothetical protein